MARNTPSRQLTFGLLLILASPVLLFSVIAAFYFAQARRWRLLLVTVAGPALALWGLQKAVATLFAPRNDLMSHPLTTMATAMPSIVAVAIGLVGGFVPLVVYGVGVGRLVEYRVPREDVDLDQALELRKRGIASSFFISYRRVDSQGICDRITAHLMRRFRGGQVFRDVNSILPGAEFTTVLSRAVDGCETMLVVIGPQWLSVTDSHGQRRLEDPHDPVRAEVVQALATGKTVIPVLVGGAILPRAEDLPAEMRPLTELHPLIVRDGESFRRDMRRLVLYHKALHPSVQHPLLWWACNSACYTCLAGLLYLLFWDPVAFLGYVGSFVPVCYNASGILKTQCAVPTDMKTLRPFLLIEGVAGLLFAACWIWTIAGAIRNGRVARAVGLGTLIVLESLSFWYLWAHRPGVQVGSPSPLGLGFLFILIVCVLLTIYPVVNHSRGVIASWVEVRSQTQTPS